MNLPVTPEQLEQLNAEQLRSIIHTQSQVIKTKDEAIKTKDEAIKSKDEAIKSKDETIKDQQAIIKYKDAVITKVTVELAHLKRLAWSKKSESLPVEQLNLFNETLQGDLGEIEQEELNKLPEQDQKKVINNRPKRKPLPPELPRTEIRHEPDHTTCSCGCQLKRIGEDVSEKLDYTPGTFTVEKHIRGKWVCNHCETLTQAPVPGHVIDKGLPTTNLLAQVLTNKFADHLPLYRQEKIFGRSGYHLSANTLGGWVGYCGAQLQPLVDALREVLLNEKALHADETPVTMLCAKSINNNKPGSKKAYLWAYASTQYSDIKAVVFDFTEGRAGAHAQNFLQDWSGTLISDDYSGYNALVKDNEITQSACMAHARRKFFDLHASHKSQIAYEAVLRFNQIYQYEAQFQNQSSDRRLELRQKHIKPLMDQLLSWLLEHKTKVSDGSGTMTAINYSLKLWSKLCVFLNDGNVPIDNNWAENQIRPIALGRKNWLFAGSLRSGKRNAAIMSLIQSAKINGHNPRAYLKDVMDRLPTLPYSQIADLLPHNWKPQA